MSSATPFRTARHRQAGCSAANARDGRTPSGTNAKAQRLLYSLSTYISCWANGGALQYRDTRSREQHSHCAIDWCHDPDSPGDMAASRLLLVINVAEMSHFPPSIAIVPATAGAVQTSGGRYMPRCQVDRMCQ
uniref:Uncharacterized protein n=1 Tax=Rhodopseudomonas palustris (strain BisA53) TaxID=316055 RepID=Q07KX0_RHOP5